MYQWCQQTKRIQSLTRVIWLFYEQYNTNTCMHDLISETLSDTCTSKQQACNTFFFALYAITCNSIIKIISSYSFLSDRMESATAEDVRSKGLARAAYKNVFGLSISNMLVFCAFQGLQGLQSSINSANGLGLISLAILYVFFVITGVVTPIIVKILGTKYALMGAMVCHFIYVASNYYPDWYTLIPSSVLLGFASAPIGAAASVHLIDIAVKTAPALKETQQNLIGQFTAIQFLFFPLSQIPGNLASSLILLYSESNVTRNNCTTNFSATVIDRKYFYILISVFLLFDITAITTLALTVDRLPRVPFISTNDKCRVFLLTPLTETFRALRNWKIHFVSFMFLMIGLEQSFIFGTFTEVYSNPAACIHN